MENKASYLLLIEPEKKVAFRVEKLRDAIRSEFDMVANPFYNPHITIFDFDQYESYEGRFLPLLKEFVAQLSPFVLKLKDFGTFGHTFYIQVKTGKELKRVSSKRGELRGIAKVPVKTQGIYHLTIFKDLSENMGEKIWEKWKEKRFEDFFPVKEMVFLRKREGQRHYLELARFPLLGKEIPPAFVQGSLFG